MQKVQDLQFNLNSPRQQHNNSRVCFWPREKFFSQNNKSELNSNKLEREINLSATSPKRR